MARAAAGLAARDPLADRLVGDQARVKTRSKVGDRTRHPSSRRRRRARRRLARSRPRRASRGAAAPAIQRGLVEAAAHEPGDVLAQRAGFRRLRAAGVEAVEGRRWRRAPAPPPRSRRWRRAAESPSRMSRSATSLTCTKASACSTRCGKLASACAVASRRRRRGRCRRDRRGRDRLASSQSPSSACADTPAP